MTLTTNFGGATLGPFDVTHGDAYNIPIPVDTSGEWLMRTALLTEPAVKQVTYLDPTGHVYVVARQLSPRLKDIKGAVAGLLDNGNDTSRAFFTSLADVLQTEYGVSQVILRTKFDHSKPAPQDMFQEMAQRADFLVSGVAL